MQAGALVHVYQKARGSLPRAGPGRPLASLGLCSRGMNGAGQEERGPQGPQCSGLRPPPSALVLESS